MATTTVHLRHDLDEADDGRDDEENAGHGQHAEQPQHQLVGQLFLEQDESRRSRNQDHGQHDDAPGGTLARTVIDQCPVVLSR